MINYRSLKKLLGETSLERKCRLLFGVALMILITTSFWMYASRTRQLVEAQQVARAHSLVPEILWRKHMQDFMADEESDPADDGNEQPETADTQDDAPQAVWPVEYRKKIRDVQEFKMGVTWDLILAGDTPADDFAQESLLAFRSSPNEDKRYQIVENEDSVRELHYFEAIRPYPSCLPCHNGANAVRFAGEDVIAMASVEIPLTEVDNELKMNRAILFFFGTVTTIVAMLVAYIIVRYIIVKPVLHLKDVSDEIARGNLNLRAEINTGDEFEELSQAFNRMLRHMTTVNDELRGVNDNLDAKVDQLAQANMELFRSNALKDEFLATMSHELRTPLNSILGFSDVLSNSQSLDNRQKRYVQNIQTSGRNLMVQINDLLDIAKIESGQMKLQPGALVLSDLVDAQCSQIMPLADQKNIELKVQYPAEPIPELWQDSGKIRQILTNLLSNAIKFTPEGGRVRVTTAILPDDMFQVCVEDTGIGIPMQEQAEIFEKFRQGTTTQGERDHVKREFGGTGLGLSIVRELSRLLGGDVHLESEFGKGSSFTIRLPQKAPPEPDATSVSLETSLDPSRSITSVDLLNTSPTSESDSSIHDTDDESPQDDADAAPIEDAPDGDD